MDFLNFRPNLGQQYIANESIKFFNDPSRQLFQIAGLAGTGKSTLLHYIIDINNIPRSRILPVAYTGAAAVVLKLNGFPNSKTIHSGFYECVEDYMRDQNGRIIFDTYHNRPKMTISHVPIDKLRDIDLIIVSEAGNVPFGMRHTLMKHGIKVIAEGDLGQLPPINDEPAFLNSGDVYQLTEPMRQNVNSNILYLAYRARKGLPIQYGYYGDCVVIDEDDLTDEMILRSDIVICGTNKKREEMNRHIRHLLCHNTDIPEYGERVICRKNNYKYNIDGINLANGLIGTVLNHPGIDGFDGRTFRIDFKPLLFNNIFFDLRCNYEYLMSDVKKREKLKKSKYTVGECFEYGYCITTYLSQGQTFNNCIYIEEYLSPEINDRQNYVGLTRAKNGVIYVKRKRKFWKMR